MFISPYIEMVISPYIEMFISPYIKRNAEFHGETTTKINKLNSQKPPYLRVSGVNRALPSLHRGSLEITLTVPLR